MISHRRHSESSRPNACRFRDRQCRDLLCPNGINAAFDTVGSTSLDAVIERMNRRRSR
jgi:hypothetical protein